MLSKTHGVLPLLLLLYVFHSVVRARGGKLRGPCGNTLPSLREMMETAFPTWHVDASGKRIAGGGKWNPLYFTKRYDGLDPSKGGYPSDRDVRYPFDFAAAFRGQPGAGSPHHCAIDAPIDTKIQSCPKIVTKSDDHPLYGPGHIPPHIAVRSVRDAALACGINTASWFDFDKHRCDIAPDILLKLIRRYYPRGASGDVVYPLSTKYGPAFWEHEFPNHEGQSHWCGAEYRATGQYADFCPYVHTGHSAGKYRHPHIGFAALQQHLAHLAMPSKCGTEWDDRGNYPMQPDTSWAWVQMVDESDPTSQPAVPYKHNPIIKKNIPGDVLLPDISALSVSGSTTHAVHDDDTEKKQAWTPESNQHLRWAIRDCTDTFELHHMRQP